MNYWLDLFTGMIWRALERGAGDTAGVVLKVVGAETKLSVHEPCYI